MAARRAAMFWSGGKDSALALDRVQRAGDYEVAALITTINPEFGRVSMHGVREELVEAQAEAAGLPLERMYVGSSASNDAYVESLRAVLARQKDSGVEAVIFGDIFLADLRAWREGFLAEWRLEGVFPLWGDDTAGLAQEFVARGFQALICCANDANLDGSAVGRPLDAGFFAGLPAGVDPCGENGEYHSFVHDGPVFSHPVRYAVGERVYRPLALTSEVGAATRGFWFLDLLPAA